MAFCNIVILRKLFPVMTLRREHTVLHMALRRMYSNQNELTILTEKEGIRRITLNNPKKRNALSLAMIEKLRRDVFMDLNNVNLRCIVIDSSGPVFSSGHDLKELSQSDQHQRTEIFQKCSELMAELRNIPVPVVAVVKGIAAAAGCQLVASCDIAIASTKSQFSTPGASVGLFCSTPGIAVSRNVPLKIASYMLFTGNNLNASDAVQYGLISKVAEEDKLDAELELVLNAIKSKSRSVLTLGKKFFYEQLDKNIEEAYRCGTTVMVDNLANQEAKEGINAFFEKRTPTWLHV